MAFPSGWGRRCKLTIQNGKVPGTETDYPVLLDLSTLPSEMFDADGSYPALSGGGDIRFSSDAAGTTRLACEVITFTTDNNPANGKAEIWVKIPSVASATDTDFYVWYNKSGETQPAETDTYGKHNVWDSNFKLVQHMNQGPSGSAPQMIDSTNNSNDGTSAGTMTSGDLVDGKIGKALAFDGINDEIDCSNGSSLDITSNFTVEAIIETDQDFVPSNGVYVNVIAKGSAFNLGYGLIISESQGDSKTKVLAWQRDATGLEAVSAEVANNFATGVKKFISGGFDGTDGFVFIDGVQAATNALTNIPGTTTDNCYIARPAGSYSAYDKYFSQGLIDEVRISNSYRSGNWKLTSYNNQNDPATFVTAGTPETMDITCNGAITYVMVTTAATGSIALEGSSAISFPVIDFSATGKLEGGEADIDWTVLSVEAAGGHAYGDGAVEFPAMTIAAEGSCTAGYAEITFPAITVLADDDVIIGEISFPALEVTASGSAFGGIGTIECPILDIAAEGLTASMGGAASTFPLPQVLGTGIVSILGTCAITFPALKVATTGLLGRTGNSALQFPILQLAGTAGGNLSGSPTITMPMLQVYGEGRAEAQTETILRHSRY